MRYRDIVTTMSIGGLRGQELYSYLLFGPTLVPLTLD